MIRFASVTPNLVVKDAGRSTAFYRDVLGFPVGMHVPAMREFAITDPGGHRDHLCRADRGK